MDQRGQDLLNKLGGDVGATVDALTGEAEKQSAEYKDRVLEKLQMAEDPEFDYSGVQDFWFRGGLARMDTPEERELYLTRTLGPAGWTRDRFGNYAVTEAGAKQRGYEFKGKPIVIDELGLSTGDIADFGGDAPAILGATGAGLRGTGLGAVKGTALTAGGAMLGKAMDEIIEELTGQNLQTAPEVVGDIAEEGAYAAAGEGIFRSVIRPLGRKMMAPYGKRMTPEKAALVQEAKDIDARPHFSQVTKPAIAGRFQHMTHMIFGDPLVEKNYRAILLESDRLRRGAGPAMKDIDLGDAVEHSIRQGRGALARWSKIVTGKIDDMTGGKDIVPTATLKLRAREILKDLPKLVDTEVAETVPSKLAGLGSVKNPAMHTETVTKTIPGRKVFTTSDLIQSLKDAEALPDYVNLSQMQAISQKLYDAIGDDTIVPGITGRNARLLWKASRDTFDDVVDPQAKAAVKSFHKKYGENIKRFDNALIERITRNPRLAGRIEPEKLVETVFRKRNYANIRRLKAAVSPGVWEKFRRAAMDDFVDKLTHRTSDPFEDGLRGKAFLDALDDYGKSTIEAMFGNETMKRLYRLGRVTQLVTMKQKMTGGLVAAHVALHPIANLGRLAKLKVMSAIMQSDFALKWLTEGLRAPKTRAGAEALSRLGTFAMTIAEQNTHESQPTPVTE